MFRNPSVMMDAVSGSRPALLSVISIYYTLILVSEEPINTEEVDSKVWRCLTQIHYSLLPFSPVTVFMTFTVFEQKLRERCTGHYY